MAHACRLKKGADEHCATGGLKSTRLRRRARTTSRQAEVERYEIETGEASEGSSNHSYLKDQIRLTVDGADGPRDVEMQCRLEPGGEGVSLVYTRTSTAQPTLKFVVVVMAQGEAPYRQEFLWCLPPHHQSRILVHLYNCVREDYQAGRDALPAVGLPFIPETFLARDADEVCRLLSIALQSEDRLVMDLLAAEGMNELEAVYNRCRLSRGLPAVHTRVSSHRLLRRAEQRLRRLQSAYREAYRKHISVGECIGPIAPQGVHGYPKAAAGVELGMAAPIGRQ